MSVIHLLRYEGDDADTMQELQRGSGAFSATQFGDWLKGKLFQSPAIAVAACEPPGSSESPDETPDERKAA